MIIDNEKKQLIRNIIKKRHLLFFLKTVGPDSLTDEDLNFLMDNGIDVQKEIENDFIKDAYDIGLTRTQLSEGSYDNISLGEFRRQPKPYTTEEMNYAVDYVKSQVVTAGQKLYASAQEKVEGIIRNKNLEYRNFLLDEPAANIVSQGIKRNATVNEMISELRSVTNDLNRDWKRVVVTELNNAMSHGSADAMRVRNPNKKPEDILVFKRVVGDEALCQYCGKFYIDNGGKPIVYKLSELQANGTNYGKKASEWKPVVGATHPNCRCTLVELPKGFGFNDKGQMSYKGSDYDILKDNKEE